MNAFDTNDDIVTLVDDEGREYTYEVLDVLEIDSQEYALLLPEKDTPDSDKILVMRFDGDDLVSIEDPEEFQEILSAIEALASADEAPLQEDS